MGKPSPPQPPDPMQVARAQTGSDIGTSIANTYMGNADTYTPFGSTTYKKTGREQIMINGRMYHIPTFDVNQTLSPDQQQLLNQQEQLGQGLNQLAINQTNRIGDILGRPISTNTLPRDYNNAPGAPTLNSLSTSDLNPNLQTQISANDFSADRDKVTQALLARANPQIERDRAALETQLANQGVTQGSAAYKNAIDGLNRQVNDQRMQAILAGGQEQSRLFGIAQQNAQFGNQSLQEMLQNRLQGSDFQNNVQSKNYDAANTQMQNQQVLRQQGLQELISLRNQPISEISQLMNGGQPTVPQFQQFQAGHISDTPVGQYMYQTAALNNQNYQSQLQQSNAAMGGMFGLGSSFLGMMPFFSDRRMKRNSRKVGTLDNGLPVYVFNYAGSNVPMIGLMADEVEVTHPEAVTEINGYKAVYYDRAVL